MDISLKPNLLIVGAGGHGRVVKETAEATHRYACIDYVDDNADNAVGTIEELINLREKYSAAFVGIGNNILRAELLKKLKRSGFQIPVLIHPNAYVSPSASIAEGTIVEPGAIVNAGAVIDAGAIISVGAIIDHDVCLGECVHINAGAICKAGCKVNAYIKLDAGQVLMK